MKPRPTKTHRCPRFVEFGSHDTSRNLPRTAVRENSELDFLRKFERSYIAEELGIAIAGREFALEGFGRADLIWLAWTSDATSNEFTALALKKRVRLTAIEAKISDWRKGLQQAFRYRYFAHRSLLVLPMETALIASRFLATFKNLRVGLWAFDARTGRLHKWFTPRCTRPMNSTALQKALRVIESSLELSQSPKCL
jgi:hypothetical protein